MEKEEKNGNKCCTDEEVESIEHKRPGVLNVKKGRHQEERGRWKICNKTHKKLIHRNRREQDMNGKKATAIGQSGDETHTPTGT